MAGVSGRRSCLEWGITRKGKEQAPPKRPKDTPARPASAKSAPSVIRCGKKHTNWQGKKTCDCAMSGYGIVQLAPVACVVPWPFVSGQAGACREGEVKCVARSHQIYLNMPSPILNRQEGQIHHIARAISAAGLETCQWQDCRRQPRSDTRKVEETKADETMDGDELETAKKNARPRNGLRITDILSCR